MKHFLPLLLVPFVMGCAQTLEKSEPEPILGNETTAQSPAEDQIRPNARPTSLNTTPPPADARTAEEFDTTTVAERAAATEQVEAPEIKLGLTVASLGAVTETGFWIKTPLAKSAGQGRVQYPENGKTVIVDLIPIDGPITAGSRMSLAAFRTLEAPLTELPVVVVYQQK